MSKTAQSTPLSDVQRHVLAAALIRSDAAVALHERVKGNAAAFKVGQALLGKALVREIRAKADFPVWRREAETGRTFSLILTKAGRVSVAQSAEPATTPDLRAEENTPGADAPASAAIAGVGSPSWLPRAGSKLAEVIALLRRDAGTSVTELMAVTGWLPHTTRAALTGLRKRGYTVTREAAAEGSVYRIADVAAAAA